MLSYSDLQSLVLYCKIYLMQVCIYVYVHLVNRHRGCSVRESIYFPVHSFALQGSENPQRLVAMRWQSPMKESTWV